MQFTPPHLLSLFKSILILSSCIKFIQWDKKNEHKCNEEHDVTMQCSTHGTPTAAVRFLARVV
jgi:hypothetical protein